MQAGEPTSSWSGNFLSKQRIASLINLFATDVTSPKTVKAAKFTLWPDLHRETLDQNLGLNLKYMTKNTRLDPWSYVTDGIKEDFLTRNLPVVPPSDVWRIIR